MTQITYFNKNLKKGQLGEKIFSDYLNRKRINYQDVTAEPYYQSQDIDFIIENHSYDVKANYNDDGYIIIEEASNYPEFDGWYNTSKADIIVFVSVKTKKVIFLPLTKEFRKHYHNIKGDYKLLLNRTSEDGFGQQWQSAFRKIPLTTIEGFFKTYN